MGAPGTPRREVVTGTPRASRAAHGTARAHEDVPPADSLVLRSLMRRQLRLSAATFGLLVALVGLLPLAFTALPDPATWPGSALVVWAVLGVAVYPALVVLGRWYVVRAERNERDTAHLVERH
ncbi:hypothetical protein [Streptomyces naphthomycinicus]|uniref:hypothetical protein n=1 Tax=Streptomyces naphthomycinicus TaxID=2872625 RepID=UPI001CEC167D|nr:hypothetical protein [Streptomyces sp. TML10]